MGQICTPVTGESFCVEFSACMHMNFSFTSTVINIYDISQYVHIVIYAASCNSCWLLNIK